MESKEYSIVASAEAFETLSSKLYTNPVAAIIRELSCNAHDSQVMAGTENKPFILHLPTYEEKYFKIRDFGLGMSDEFVMNVFTTYFASTKSNSENQIGAFGLGSKTPYALVDKYYVTSFYEGRKLSYEMSKKNGCPVVEKISDEESDEPCGLSIMFDLSDKWYEGFETNFKEEAKNFFFKTKFQPDWNIELQEEELKKMAMSKYFFNDDNVVLVGEDDSFVLRRRYYEPKLTVNVAGVVFKVQNDKIDYVPDFYDCVNLMADKSDVTVTPSREDLHYDDKTIDFINTKLAKVLEHKNIEILENINSKNISYIELRNMANISEIPEEISNAANELLSNIFLPMSFRIEGRSVRRSKAYKKSGYYRGYVNSNVIPYIGLLNTKGCKNAQINTINATLAESENETKVSSKTFCDRVKFFFENRTSDEGERFILVAREGKEDIAKQLLSSEKNEYDDFVYANCVPEKKEGSKTRRGFITQSTFIYKNYENVDNGYRRSISNPDVKPDEIPLVINTDRVSDFSRYFDVLKKIKPDTNIVLRVCKEESSIKNICSANKGAENALDWAKSIVLNNKEVLKDSIKATFLNDKISKFSIYPTRISEDDIDNFYSLKGKFNKNVDSILDDILFVFGNQELIDRNGLLRDVFSEESKQYDSEAEEIFKKYPLLKWIGSYSYYDETFECIKNIFDYISLVDSKK